jgi:hypothetical protein
VGALIGLLPEISAIVALVTALGSAIATIIAFKWRDDVKKSQEGHVYSLVSEQPLSRDQEDQLVERVGGGN